MTQFQRVPLTTGVTLNVALAGDPSNPAVILLHGFPESHRTWREVSPRLEKKFFLIMPDQRGFAASDLPQEVEAYSPEILIDDIFSLADAFALGQFALVGHDWGGAIAWGAALRCEARLTRLAIINAPHPLTFQRSLIESAEQRAASQYITAFRSRGFDKMVEDKGFDWFFETSFARHVDLAKVADSEKRSYVADWSRPGAFNSMLNWYRASRIVVPPAAATMPLPEWVLRAFPKVMVPVSVIWGMKDIALLPLQLDGLDQLVEDLRIVRLWDAGHFAPWEAGEEVASALELFLGGQAAASAAAQ